MKLVVKDDATIQHGRVVLGTSAGAKCRTSLDGDLLRQLTRPSADGQTLAFNSSFLIQEALQQQIDPSEFALVAGSHQGGETSVGVVEDSLQLVIETLKKVTRDTTQCRTQFDISIELFGDQFLISVVQRKTLL